MPTPDSAEFAVPASKHTEPRQTRQIRHRFLVRTRNSQENWLTPTTQRTHPFCVGCITPFCRDFWSPTKSGWFEKSIIARRQSRLCSTFRSRPFPISSDTPRPRMRRQLSRCTGHFVIRNDWRIVAAISDTFSSLSAHHDVLWKASHQVDNSCHA
jgi:hypothetical protein